MFRIRGVVILVAIILVIVAFVGAGAAVEVDFVAANQASMSLNADNKDGHQMIDWCIRNFQGIAISYRSL